MFIIKLDKVHSECQRCANLVAWNLHMDGNHDYCCKCRSYIFINKNFPKGHPCGKFVDKDCKEDK